MASRFKLARAGAGVTVAAAALMMTAAVPASADSVGATVNDGGTRGLAVNVGEGERSELRTQLLDLTLNNGATAQAYCVEIDVALDRSQELVEQAWANFPDGASAFNENAEKINSVLANGFPVRSTAQIARTLRDQGVALNDGSLSIQEAVAGTQAAIWKFSDNADLDREEPVPGDARAGQDVLAVFDLLTGPDNTGIGEESDEAALNVDPRELTGQAGERIGPFEVRTNGTIEKLATSLPEGVRVTDAEGNELNANQIADTSKLFFDVPADQDAGSANFRLTALANVDAGRLFVSQNYEKDASQTLIVASSEEKRVNVQARASWAAEGQEAPIQQGKNDVEDDDLATTGASILIPALVGVGLLVLGFGAMFLMRRRDT
jgi:TQXA domain-containing protein